MGFKCSVLGHRFDEPGLVHEREPRGDEVITIRRKVMVCTLCGKQRVIAENKEITNGTHRDDTNDGDDSSVDDETSTHEREDGDDTSDEMDERDGVETNESRDGINERSENEPRDEINERGDIDTDEREEDGASIVEESGIGGIDVVQEQGVTVDVDTTNASAHAQRDDGIVLSDDRNGRAYGEWPDDAKATGTDDRLESNALGGLSETGTDYVENNDYSDHTPIDTETDTGEIITDDDPNENTGGETETGTDERIVKSLCCPLCGFTVSAPDSPFRSGDSCPKCRSEYLIDKT